ncbi:9728_t:CDS:2, partial [Entrophospora sp. SA101]
TEENISFISNVPPIVVSNDDTLTVSSQKISLPATLENNFGNLCVKVPVE